MSLPKVPDTIQLRGKYHAKMRVPESIRTLWDGKDIYQKSLKTADPEVARKETRRLRAIMDSQVEQAKAADAAAALARHLPPDQKALLERAGGLSGLLEEFERGKTALAFMQAGAPADPGEFDVDSSPNGEPVKVHVGPTADSESVQVEQEEHRAASAAVRAQVNARGRTLRKMGQEVELDGDVFSLRDVVDKWAPTVDPQTADAARYYVRRFTELKGEIAVTDLTKAHLRDFAEAIRGLPKITSGKVAGGRYVRDLSFAEAVKWAQREKKETLSDKTRAKYVALLKRLTAFAVQQDYAQADPWSSYKMVKTKQKHSEAAKDDRRPFTPDEVKRVLDFVSGSNEPQYSRATVDFWAPWIAAHHGLRIQEICQLRVCDFADRDGVYCVQITDEGEDQRAKSGATVRWVPVHPKLLEIGLRKHIESRPADGWAFSEWGRYSKKLEELTADKRGRVSTNYGKRFGRLRGHKLGINGDKVSFHSFRHRLQDAADTVGMPDSHRRYLTGRANADAVEDGYGEGAAMPALLESLRKVDPTK